MSSNQINMSITKKRKRIIFKKFSKKDKAIKYANERFNVNLYANDLNEFDAMKDFYVSSDEKIFEMINEGVNNWYEIIQKNQPVSFGMDLDVKNFPSDTSKDKLDKYITSIIDKVILFFNSTFNINISHNNFLLTKSPYCKEKNKHSFHLKLTGYKFPCIYVVKYYFNKINFEGVSGIDDSVYRAGLIRLSFCTKKGQQRPLTQYYIGNDKPTYIYNIENNIKEKFKFFTKTKWTYVKEYEELDISDYRDYLEKLEEDKKKQEEEYKEKINKFYENENESFSPSDLHEINYNELKKLLGIINVERFSDNKNWMILCWILKNQNFDCYELFKAVSEISPKYCGEKELRRVWDIQSVNKYPFTIATLKYWARLDNEDLFYKFENVECNFDNGMIDKIIKENTNKDAIVIHKEYLLSKIINYVNKFFVKIVNMKGKIYYAQIQDNDIIVRDKKSFLEFLENVNLNFKYIKMNNDGDISYVNYPCLKNGDIKNVGRLWLVSKKLRHKQKLIFRPEENYDAGNDLNYYRGIAMPYETCEEFKDCEIKPLQDHILNIWCKGDEKIYNYTINLLAYYLQYKHVKSGVAIVVSGDKGTGKSCIVEKFLKIFGKYGNQVEKLDGLIGNFNSVLKNCLVCYVNEATFTGNKEETNKLRNLISAPTININEKFMVNENLDSYTNFIIDGNSDQLVCNHGQERRFFILETDNKWRGINTKEKKEYFDKIINVKPEAMAKWLYDIDLKNFDPRQIPITEKLIETRMDSFNAHESFFFDIIQEGTHEGFEKFIAIKDFYEEYLMYVSTGYKLTKSKFGRLTRKLMIVEKKSVKILGKVNSCIKFKPVQDQRQHWEKMFGKLNWT